VCAHVRKRSKGARLGWHTSAHALACPSIICFQAFDAADLQCVTQVRLRLLSYRPLVWVVRACEAPHCLCRLRPSVLHLAKFPHPGCIAGSRCGACAGACPAPAASLLCLLPSCHKVLPQRVLHHPQARLRRGCSLHPTRPHSAHACMHAPWRARRRRGAGHGHCCAACAGVRHDPGRHERCGGGRASRCWATAAGGHCQRRRVRAGHPCGVAAGLQDEAGGAWRLDGRGLRVSAQACPCVGVGVSVCTCMGESAEHCTHLYELDCSEHVHAQPCPHCKPCYLPESNAADVGCLWVVGPRSAHAQVSRGRGAWACMPCDACGGCGFLAGSS